MKPAQHLSASSNKLASVQESTYKKGPLSPKLKEKHSAKLVRDKMEPMVLRSPPTGESVVRYALPIPSSKTKELIAEDEMIRKITKHLKMVVSTFEDIYGLNIENGVMPIIKSENEELPLSVGDGMNSFLVCCSQLASQLEESVKKERNILESLFKWFQQQVNHMEEISKDQTLLEAELLAADKTISIAQLVTLMQKLEDLRNRLKQGIKLSSRTTLTKSMDKESQIKAVKSYEIIQQKIEEFIKSHSSDEFVDVSATESQTTYSLANRLNTMFQIFENQSNVLERTIDDQDLLESKYKEMQSDLELLSEEKLELENELQKLKSTEITQKTKPDRTKKSVKTGKKKEKGKSENLEQKMSAAKLLKMQEDLLQAQKTARTLETENKILQEQLKKALQEAERTKHQLDGFLNQGKELPISEGKTKPLMDIDISKTKVKEESKNKSLDRETRRSLVSDSGGQKTNNSTQEHPKIPLVKNGRPIEESSEKKRSSPAISDISQMLKSQDGSAFLKSSKEVLVEDLSHTFPSENHDKSFTMITPSEGIPDSLPVEISPQENEAEASSFVSLPVLSERKSMGSDISKADVSEDNIQRNIEKQIYQAAREDQGEKTYEISDSVTPIYPDSELKDQTEFGIPGDNIYYEVADENLLLAYEDSELTQIEQDLQTTRMDRRHAFLIALQSNEEFALVSKVQSQIKKINATRIQSFHSNKEELYENPVTEHQDSKIVKKQRTFKGERLTFYNDISDENLVLQPEDSVSHTQLQLRKQKTTRGKNPSTHFVVPDENLTLMQQPSTSKTQMQEQRQMTSGGGRHNTFSLKSPQKDILLEKVLPENVLLSRSQSQTKKLQTTRDENIITQKVDDLLYENVLPEDKIVFLKSQSQVKKPEAIKMETITNQDMNRLSDETLTLEDLESTTGHKNQFQTSDTDQSQSLRKTNTGHLTDTTGKDTTKGEIETQSKNQPDMSLFKNKDISIPQQEDNFSKHVVPSTFPTKVVTLSPFSNQGVNLLINKDMPIQQHQEVISNREVTPSKVPKKVINLSPFNNQEETFDDTSPHVAEPPKTVHKKSRVRSSFSKSIHRTSLNQVFPGQSKNIILNQRAVNVKSPLPPVTSKSKKPIHKVLNTSTQRKYVPKP
ncbi:coiled-coil domain-containing protein 7 isoform X2 [Tupaia chinensis]|uniref:coiled-coil domain-containing protein 7 isoform X2 n=1 Tax=Tupaia chinensis TaxID=246437 RepID=UPI000FFB9420|nr:coiled-coil domain-containing protein 7 isoform X2 [Tupaia chinensis]